MITATSILLLTASACATPPQSPKTAKPEAAKPTLQAGEQGDLPTLARLAADVAKAHRPKASEEKIHAYRASIVIKPQGKDQDSVDISLNVLYGDAVERAAGKTMPMMLYGTNEGGQTITRGDSHDGIWHKVGTKKAVSLTGRSHQTDKELVRNHRRLCKVMLRFLDPGTILGSLKQATKVQTSKLRVKRGRKGELDTYLVSGTLSGFPVARGPQKIKDEMVWLEAWVDTKSSRLRAVRVFPMTPDGKPQWKQGEHILLDKLTAVDGICMPLRLRFFQVTDHNKTTPKLLIDLQKITLNPALSKLDFAKPQ